MRELSLSDPIAVLNGNPTSTGSYASYLVPAAALGALRYCYRWWKGGGGGDGEGRVKGNILTVNIVMGAMGGVEGVEMGMRLARVWWLRLTGYEMEEAFRVYEVMRKKRYGLDVIGFNILIDALAKDQKVLGSLVLGKFRVVVMLDAGWFVWQCVGVDELEVSRGVWNTLPLFESMVDG
ncbi:hypothetical protein Droror1_Dr00026684 [Drosera rotundifolia]